MKKFKKDNTMSEKITIEYFEKLAKKHMSIYDMDRHVRDIEDKFLIDNKVSHNDKPVYPFKGKGSTSKEFYAFAKKLEVYENELELFKNKAKEVKEKISEYVFAFECYIKDQAGLYTIPKIAQMRVWSLAYKRGHSSGLNEIYNELINLVELFEGIEE